MMQVDIYIVLFGLKMDITSVNMFKLTGRAGAHVLVLAGRHAAAAVVPARARHALRVQRHLQRAVRPCARTHRHVIHYSHKQHRIPTDFRIDYIDIMTQK